MELSKICEDYFNGFQQASHHKSNDRKTNALAALKIASYFTVVIPLAVALVYGVSSLCGRVSKKPALTPVDKKVASEAKKTIPAPAPLPAALSNPSLTKTVLNPSPSPSFEKPPISDSKVEAPVEQKEIPKHLDIRGSRWLEYDVHLWLYVQHLASIHPSLLLFNCGNLYVVKKNLEDLENLVGNAILMDLHLNNKECVHQHFDIECKDKTILAYPLHVSGNHWTLVLVDRNKRTIEYFDSKKDYGNHNEIKQYLEQFAQTLSEKDPGATPYQFDCKIEKNLQPDAYQCGVWTLYFLKERLQNPDIDFNQLDVEQAQAMIANFRVEVQGTLVENHA